MLNVYNFYDELITFLNHAIKNYFISSSMKKLFICALTVNELLNLLQVYKPEPDPITLDLDWSTNDDGSNPRKKCQLDLILYL